MSLEDLSTPTDIGSGVVIAKTSGQIITVASGSKILAAITDDAGSNVVDVFPVNIDGASTEDDSLSVRANLFGYEAGGAEWNRIRVNKSGQGALVVASSGQDYILVKAGIESGHIAIQSGRVAVSSGTVHVMSGQLIAKTSGEVTATTRRGKSDIIFTGYACTNTLVYSGVSFTEHDKATIHLHCYEEGSGVEYTVRGSVVSGIDAYSITSGAMTSGEVVVETISDPYDWIEVGTENLVDNYTGVVTVLIARR